LTSAILFERILLTMTFHVAAMETSIAPSLYATDVADYLVNKGLPFRQAHEIAGRLVQIAEQTGITLADLPLEVFKRESELFAKDVTTLFDPILSINKRNVIGGTGVSSVKKQIELAQKLLKL
ncbi:MAG: argininosuccinate lyase, partial [Calditrichaeota bacterium]